jgi:pSer/pThr/pTyr-binding forkhead associated (FHA) protein
LPSTNVPFESRIRIGRDLRCDIVVEEETAIVSRFHAEIQLGPGGVWVLDTDSMSKSTDSGAVGRSTVSVTQ